MSFISYSLPHLGVEVDPGDTLGAGRGVELVKAGQVAGQAEHDHILDHKELALAEADPSQGPER